MAPFGYGVTNAPVNLNTQWGLYPYNMTSNYGMATQYYTLPSYATPLEAFLTRDITNPNGIGQVNPMLYGFDLGQNGNNGSSQLGVKQAGEYGYREGVKARIKISLESANITLTSMHKSLENILKSDKLNDSQKDRVNELIVKIEELQKRLADIENATVEEAEAFQGEALELGKEVNELAKTLTEEIKNNKSEDADDTEDTDEADDTTSADESSDKKTSKKEKEKTEKEYVATQICHKIDTAIDGTGTNYDDDENGLLNVMKTNINANNVLELFDAWDKTYAKVGDYADDGDGFIESLMDDCEGDQKEEIALILIDALEQRAHEKGIDVSAEIAAARNSVKSNWIGYRDDGQIQKTVNALRKVVSGDETVVETAKDKKIQEKETAKKTKKAEQKAKQEEKIKAKKAEFIEDMKEITERDDIKAMPSGVEIVKDDKGNFKCFKIRIKGKDYEGKNYLDLVKKLEKDDKTLPLK